MSVHCMSSWSSVSGWSVNGCGGCVSHAVAWAFACVFNMTLRLPFLAIAVPEGGVKGHRFCNGRYGIPPWSMQ
eukprot:2909021-Alexandrium_andersonii.AAC.1